VTINCKSPNKRKKTKASNQGKIQRRRETQAKKQLGQFMKLWHKKKRMEAEERKYPCPNKNAGSTERRTDGRCPREARGGEATKRKKKTEPRAREERKGTSLKKIEPRVRARVRERERDREQAAYAT
jgi:hypothetical protein